MRRAVIATVGTVAAVVAILQYKSSGKVDIGGGKLLQPASSSAAGSAANAPATSTPAPTSPATSPTTSSGAASSTGTSPATSPSTTAPAASAGPTGQFTGSDVTFAYGEIEARLTFKDGKITSVDYPIDSAPDPRSQMINSEALPILTQELLRAQSLRIDAVSGATFTSNAFAETVQAALSKAGKG